MAEQASSQDFRVLGLKEGASRKEVKTAYREMAKRWHPDRFQGKAVSEQQRAEEIFKEISGAYRRISRGWTFSDNVAGGREEKKSEESSSAEERAASEEPTGERQGEPGPSQEEAAPSEEHPRREAQARFQGLQKSLQSLRVFIEKRRNLLGAALMLLLLIIALLPLFKTTTTHLPTGAEPARHAAPSVIVSGPEGTPSEEDESPRSEGENAPAAPRTISTPPPSAGWVEKDYNAGAAYFTMGSTQAAVVRVQGAPTRVRGQVWVYGLSEVQFRDGRVVRYDNFDGNLKVRMVPSAPSTGAADPHEFFTIGATMDEVLAVQGSPTRADSSRWGYGFSEVRFKDQRAVGFDNFFGNLKIKILPSPSYNPTERKEYFTTGSSQDEVLAVQGTPSSIQGNMWFYSLSNILFRDGRVQTVADASGALRFIPSDGAAKNK